MTVQPGKTDGLVGCGASRLPNVLISRILAQRLEGPGVRLEVETGRDRLTRVMKRIIVLADLVAFQSEKIDDDRVRQPVLPDQQHRPLHPDPLIMRIGPRAHYFHLRPLAIEEMALTGSLLGSIPVPEILRQTVYHHRVMCYSLHRVGVVLRQVASTEFGLDIDPSAKAIIVYNLTPLIEENEVQFIKVTVPAAMYAILHQQHGFILAPAHTQDAKSPLLAVVTIREFDRWPVHIGRRIQCGVVTGNLQPRTIQNHPILNPGNAEQALVRAVLTVRQCIRQNHFRRRHIHRAGSIVDRGENAIGKSGLHSRIVGFAKNPVTVVVDTRFRLHAVYRLGKIKEGHERIADIVRPFHVIAVGRKKQVELRKKPPLPVQFRAVQRLLDERPVAHHVRDHSDGGDGPGTVVMNPVEFLFIAYGEPFRHRTKDVRLEARAFFFGKPFVDAIVRDAGMDQPDLFIERLVKYLAGFLIPRKRVRTEGGVQNGVFLQHIPHERCVPLFPGNAVEQPGVSHLPVVLLVPLVLIAARFAR